MDKRLLRATLPGFLLITFFACSKKDEAPAVVYKSSINLDDAVADQGCLSLPKLYAGVRAINPAQPVVSVPTSIDFISDYSIRENFKRSIAYGQLEVSQKPFSDLQAFPSTSQDACSTFTLSGTDHVDKVYTVKSSSRESVAGEAEDGERYEFTWLGPQSLKIQRKYLAYDAPCSPSDRPIFVSLTRVLDWSQPSVPAVIPEKGSPQSIDPGFISLAAAAVGDDPSGVYTVAADGTRVLDVAKISAMMQKSPRPEILSCNGTVEPTPAPNPDPQPTPTPTPDPNDPNHPPRDGGDGTGPRP